jgi:hypothetical protein
MGDVLGMATMIFADEIVPPDRLDELPDESVETSDRELDIARQLVESLAGNFEPEKYHDTYREEVLQLIERKAQGEEIVLQPPPEEEPSEVPDLMSALQASLDEVRRRTEDLGDGAPRRRPAADRARRPAAGDGRGRRAASGAKRQGASRSPSRSPSKPEAKRSGSGAKRAASGAKRPASGAKRPASGAKRAASGAKRPAKATTKK